MAPCIVTTIILWVLLLFFYYYHHLKWHWCGEGGLDEVFPICLSRTEAVKRWRCVFFIGFGGGPCPQHCAPWGPCQDQGGGPAGPGVRCDSVLILKHLLSKGKDFPFIAWGLNLCLFSPFYALCSPLSPEFSPRPSKSISEFTESVWQTECPHTEFAVASLGPCRLFHCLLVYN